MRCHIPPAPAAPPSHLTPPARGRQGGTFVPVVLMTEQMVRRVALFFLFFVCRCQTRFSPADLRQAAARHWELCAAASVSLLNYHRRVSKHTRSELMPQSFFFFFFFPPQIWNKAAYFLFALHHHNQHHHHHHRRPGAADAAWVRYSSLQQRIRRFIGESSVVILCMCSNLDTIKKTKKHPRSFPYFMSG